MKIQPPDSGKTPQTGPNRLRPTPPAPPAKPAGETARPAPAPDQVELSEAARQLAERLGVEPGALAALPPERLKHILERVAQGYYDRPEVRDQVARRLLGDLEPDL
jgi:hypothetical protein